MAQITNLRQRKKQPPPVAALTRQPRTPATWHDDKWDRWYKKEEPLVNGKRFLWWPGFNGQRLRRECFAS